MGDTEPTHAPTSQARRALDPKKPRARSKVGNGKMLLAGVDLRSSLYREFQDVAADLAHHMGGDPTAVEAALIEEAAGLILWCTRSPSCRGATRSRPPDTNPMKEKPRDIKEVLLASAAQAIHLLMLQLTVACVPIFGTAATLLRCGAFWHCAGQSRQYGKSIDLGNLQDFAPTLRLQQAVPSVASRITPRAYSS